MGRFLLIILLLCVNAWGQAVDHNNLSEFETLQREELAAARNLKILFMDRSVGFQTNEALTCLTAKSYGRSKPICRRERQYINGRWTTILRSQKHHDSGMLDSYIDFEPSNVKYNRDNIDFYMSPVYWTDIAIWFTEGLHNNLLIIPETGETIHPLDYDVVSFQFSYACTGDDSRINDWFTHLPGDFDDAYDLEREITENLDPLGKKFIYWTTSLSRVQGNKVATDFNNTMREWADDHGRPLFDFADIESHNINGRPCFDPTGTYPAICEEKTPETEGGHIVTAQGSVAAAKGFWVISAMTARVEPSSPPAPPD